MCLIILCSIFFFYFVDFNSFQQLLDQLPDELGDASAQNGVREIGGMCGPPVRSSTNSHQQLSQLLAANTSSPVSVSSTLATNASRLAAASMSNSASLANTFPPNIITSLQTSSMKSPLSKMMGSPPNVPANKPGMAVSMGQQGLPSDYIITSTQFNSNGIVSGTLASTVNTKTLTTPTFSTQYQGLQQPSGIGGQGQMMNGPGSRLGMPNVTGPNPNQSLNQTMQQTAGNNLDKFGGGLSPAGTLDGNVPQQQNSLVSSIGLLGGNNNPQTGAMIPQPQLDGMMKRGVQAGGSTLNAVAGNQQQQAQTSQQQIHRVSYV